MAELKEFEKDTFKELVKKYGLTPEHFFKHKHYTIIIRAGVDLIQAAAGITVTYEELPDQCSSDHKYFLIKATCTDTNGNVVQTYGEVSPSNNTMSYPVAIAEKRAMARGVLKLSGLYALNVFSEDEAESFAKPEPKITTRAKYKESS